MKKLVLVFAVIIPSICFSQPMPSGWGFYNCDTIGFEEIVPYNIHIDTSAGCIWQRGNPAKTVFTAALSGNKSLVTDTVNTYPASNRSSFIIDLYNDSSIDCRYSNVIQFVHSLNTDSLAGGYIEVSYDSTNWVNVFSDQQNVFGFRYGIFKKNNFAPEPLDLQYIQPDTLFNGELGFKGNYSADSLYLYFEFNVVKSNLYMPRFRFTFVSDSLSQSKDGWMIDHIVMGGYSGWGSTNETLSRSIKTYPNPAIDRLAFDIDEKQFKPTTYRITNIVGQQLSQGIFTTKPLDVANLTPGAYIITLTDAKGNAAAKVFYKQ